MANMTVNQRTKFERVDLKAVPSTGVQVKNRKLLVAFTMLALAAAGRAQLCRDRAHRRLGSGPSCWR